MFSQERKDLLHRKLRPYVAKQLPLARKAKRMTYQEIAWTCDVNPGRISEAAKRQYLSYRTLRRLIDEGFIDFEDLKAYDRLTPKEVDYLVEWYSIGEVEGGD